MKLRKLFSKRKMAIGLLAGVYLFTWVPNILADDFDPRKNIIAIHDSSSDEYKNNCSECHASILSEESLNPSIPTAHESMFGFAPGKPGDNKQCIWCHRTVDLVQGSAGLKVSGVLASSLRKQVDATLCAMCHAGRLSNPDDTDSDPIKTIKKFYQDDLLPYPPDGMLLYDLSCAACHKDLANSKVSGESADEIQEKIDKNKGGMRPLIVLSAPEIQAIADELARSGGHDDEHDDD